MANKKPEMVKVKQLSPTLNVGNVIHKLESDGKGGYKEKVIDVTEAQAKIITDHGFGELVTK